MSRKKVGVGFRFEELDWRQTPMGEISLRRRREPVLDVDIYEVQLNEEFLMSSLFTVSETELAHLGLAAHDREGLDVLVGGLGLGYTAKAALADPRTRQVVVVEAIAPVIDWHRRRLLPDTVGLASDPRCELVNDDFFALVAQGRSERTYDVVLVDIDHTPDHVLNPGHSAFYCTEGLRGLRSLLRPDGVFALWSDDPPAEAFLATLRIVFDQVSGHVVSFPNPHTGGTSACSVYVARHVRPATG
jgi:spermidine synthase